MRDLPQALSAHGDRLLFMRDVRADIGVTDRAIRKWIAKGTFPQPDANLRGRNCWRMTTFLSWKADVLAGKYSQRRRPGAVVSAA